MERLRLAYGRREGGAEKHSGCEDETTTLSPLFPPLLPLFFIAHSFFTAHVMPLVLFFQELHLHTVASSNSIPQKHLNIPRGRITSLRGINTMALYCFIDQEQEGSYCSLCSITFYFVLFSRECAVC